ncbi:alpha/beta hydrolase [Sulfitobacter sp.]|uniref:alpha/beta hydrolase n=1 Tax=Sulfitobacter sp. TaxID=1903071 RepID=UPI003001443E
MIKSYFLALLFIACTGCATRDQIAMVPPVEGAVQHTVLFATNRAPSNRMFNETRSLTTSYGEAIVAVPPEHEVGVVEYPATSSNPHSEFGVVHAGTTTDLGDFKKILTREVDKRASGNRSAIVYVHGFNSTFAEALYLNTQLMHDYERSEVPIMFSWPSSGQSLAYLHDHESILSARNPLEKLLETLEGSDLDSFTVVAHSMGSQLVMETLRQHAIRTGGRHWSKLNGVVLVSPDIDVQVFAQLSTDMGELPDPFIVIASKNDKLLSLSGVINGSKARVGGVISKDALPASSKATLVGASFATDVWSSNHMTAFRSPEMIRYLNAFETTMPEAR